VPQIDYPLDCGLFNVITSGSGLNNHGAVVGSYECSVWKHTEAFVWTPESGFMTLPRPPGVYSAAAADINDHGTIVGYFSTAASMVLGFVYTELPPQPGGLWSWCNAINNQGTVVGARSVGPGITPYNAIVWSAEEGLSDLGVMKGPFSSASDIGPEGQVVGATGDGINFSEAFLLEDERLTLLGPIPGGVTSGAGAVGQRIVVGGGRIQLLPGGPQFGFLWHDGQFTLIDPIAGYDTSAGNDINSVHQVAGHSVRLKNVDDSRAFLWQHGVTVDLNTLVPVGTPTLRLARAINDDGQILAQGGVHTALLTPVGRPLGDLDIDCRVSITDFLRLLGAWGEAESPADLNGDGTVDQADFTILIANWG
jgi:uncharacterized membrane protein